MKEYEQEDPIPQGDLALRVLLVASDDYPPTAPA